METKEGAYNRKREGERTSQSSVCTHVAVLSMSGICGFAQRGQGFVFLVSLPGFWGCFCPAFRALLAITPAASPLTIRNARITILISPFFARQKKKGFSFFSCGATPSRTVPKTQPLRVAFSLRERADLRSQKEGILGKKIAWGRVGRTGQKKEKRMHKKRWVIPQNILM